jgi:hypothetical protein
MLDPWSNEYFGTSVGTFWSKADIHKRDQRVSFVPKAPCGRSGIRLAETHQFLAATEKTKLIPDVYQAKTFFCAKQI